MVAGDPRARAARGWCTTAPARTWPAAWPPRCSTRRRGATATLGLFEVDEFWLGQVVDELQPRALLLANLFRDQLDRYGELEHDRRPLGGVVAARRRAALVLNADDPPSPTSAASARDGVTYFGVEDDALALAEMQHAADAKHCRRCGARLPLRRRLPRPPRPLPLPDCGGRRPEPRSWPRDVELTASRGARFTLARRRERRASRCPSPASTTSTTRSAPPRSRLALGRRARRRRRRPGRRRAGVRPRRDARARRPRPRSCSSRTRPAPTRSCARCALEDGEHDLLGRRSTTTSPTAATSPGSGTPTSSCSRRACAA